MKKIELVLVGDLHLGRLETVLPDKNWRKFSFQPLQQIELYAKKHGIKHVINTGDVFDVANPSQDLLKSLMQFLLSAKCTWHFGIGNHDLSMRKKHSLVVLEWLTKQRALRQHKFYSKAIKTKINSLPVIFLPYPITKHVLLNTNPALIIAHADRAGMRYDNGRQITGKKFRLGKHFWCIGHLHTFQRGWQFVFPGGISQWRFGDADKQFFLHATIKFNISKIVVKYKRIPIKNAYSLSDLEIHKTDDWRKLDQLKPQQYIRLLIDASVADVEKYIKHPQVLKHRFFGDRQALQLIKTDEFSLERAKIAYKSRLQLIDQYLKKQRKLPKPQRKLAVKLAAKLERELLQI